MTQPNQAPQLSDELVGETAALPERAAAEVYAAPMVGETALAEATLGWATVGNDDTNSNPAKYQ